MTAVASSLRESASGRPSRHRLGSLLHGDAALDCAHRATLTDLESLSEAVLDEACPLPHRMFSTKHGALVWTAQHEFLHAGQIGLLRRLLGSDPVW